MRLLGQNDAAHELAPDAGAPAVGRKVDGRELGVESEARLGQRQRRREADHAAGILGDDRRRAVRRGAEHPPPQRLAVLDAHRVEVGVGHDAAVGRAPALDPHPRDAGGVGRDCRSHVDAALHRDVSR